MNSVQKLTNALSTIIEEYRQDVTPVELIGILECLKLEIYSEVKAELG